MAAAPGRHPSTWLRWDSEGRPDIVRTAAFSAGGDPQAGQWDGQAHNLTTHRGLRRHSRR
ncbi:hypothetical protein [Streptomyces lydicus]|uniref:hypothetical protein n=1 Tax=Streptomyces lydicus TaxID=47763 RepID=UPI0010113283|nr:hypothetical protein [Streptomyces lydicus]MCZ1011890.1 hypothetical protein [Streptomyces lydicus]